jgi:Zn-dependent protease with chaperone function
MSVSPIVKQLKHPKEKAYGVLVLIVGTAIWLVLLGPMLGILFGIPFAGPAFMLAVLVGILLPLIGAAVYRAIAFGNMTLLGPNQFPELYRMVQEGTDELGLAKTPTTFLYNSNGTLQAYARRLLGGKYVFLTSALVDVQNDAQVRFVIGHELGHHAAGHLNPWLNALKLPGHYVPLLGAAYSRGREYTCDRVGAYLAEDVRSAQSALQTLACGCRRLNTAMNCEAFAAQDALVPPLFGFLVEIFSGYPRLTRRVLALREQSVRRRTAQRDTQPVEQTAPFGDLEAPAVR